MKLSKLWVAGFLAVAIAAVAMVAVACGEAEPVTPAEPAMSAADIADAVRSAVSETQMSEEDMAAMMSDQIAEQVAAMAAANPGLTPEEVNAMIAGAVGEASAMLGDQLAMMEEGMSEEEMAAMMQAAIDEAVSDAVAMAIPEEEMMEERPDRAASGQKFGGSLKVATSGFLSFDPDQMGVGAGGDLFYFHRAFDGLIEVGPEGELVNQAIESWETNDLQSVYTMKVRPNMRFHDGHMVEAEDIKYTIERMLSPESSSPVRSTLTYIDSIEAPDASTLVFNLTGSNVGFPRDLSDYHLRVLPSHVDYSQITDGSVGGSGPFIKVSHNPAELTAYERNPNYWDGDKPYIDELVLFYMPEVTTRMEALRAGATDYGGIEDLSQLQWFEDQGNILVKQIPTGALRNFTMDNREPGTYSKPDPDNPEETITFEAGSVFHDKNLRKAIQYGYDRNFVAETGLYGAGIIANDHPVVSFDQYYWEEQVQVNLDVERAKGYLAAAGYEDGIDLTLDVMENCELLDAGLAFKENLADIGINVEVVNNPRDTYWTEVWLVTPFNGACWGGRPASQALSLPLRSTGDWNESHWTNHRFDELLDLAATELDFQKRKDYYRELQEILIEEVPTTYTYFVPNVSAHWNHVYGVKLHPYFHIFYQDWWIER